MTETITITFCDTAENHVGMQKIGKTYESGFTLSDLKRIKSKLLNKNPDMKIKIYSLHRHLNDSVDNERAYILIAKNAIPTIIGENKLDKLHSELTFLEWDSKARMYGRVVNKHARHNLVFADFTQSPDYESGKGTVVDFSELKYLNRIRKLLKRISKTELVAEGNRYYDSSRCGIGFHGDSERTRVIGIRIGETLPLVLYWYQNGERISERIEFTIDNGDLYVFSDKTVGYDWKRKNIRTLRHAAGCEKFTK